MVSGRKTNFFPRQNQKNIMLNFGGIVSQKMVFVFLFSLGKSWFSFPKPSFSWEKVGFPVENHFFLRKLGISLQDQVFRSKECVFHLLFVHVAN